MRCAWVKIDTARLAVRLWQSQGQWASDIELQQWLEDRGYHRVGGHWYLQDGPVADLEPNEILEVQTRVTEDGVTFVTRDPPQHIKTAPAPPPTA